MTKKTSTTSKKLNFEQSLDKLEVIVEALESGDQSLDEALKCFEQGIELTRKCQTALSSAEQSVKLLTEKNGELILQETELDTFEN